MKQLGLLTATILALVLAAGFAVAVSKRTQTRDRHSRESAKTFKRSPLSSIIAGTLKEHEDDDESTMIDAFEEALEVEARMERQLARETGLRA